MLTIDKINELFGIEESFHAPYKLNKILKDKEQREELFDLFLQEETNLTFDWFTEYFQAEQSDRKNLMQDYTPDSIVALTSELLGSTKSNADLCAGTGGLTIKRWSANKDASFWCEEYSDRAMPFLLFNLAIRNMNAIVCHGDSLTREFKAFYQLKSSERYSSIEQLDEAPNHKYQTVIMNPPYSLKWDPSKSNLTGTLPPKSKADYAFVLEGLEKLEEDGTMAVILPHGVLFRGSSEGEIRQQLIEQGLLDAVIGLPAKLFMNTDIPTAILIFSRIKQNNNLFVIDASREFEKGKNHNILTEYDVGRIIQTYRRRHTVEKYASVVDFSNVRDNDFNLNIPRYVDTFEPEPIEPLGDILADLKQIDTEIAETNKELGSMMSQLVDSDPEENEILKQMADYFSGPKIIEVKQKSEPQLEGEQLSLL